MQNRRPDFQPVRGADCLFRLRACPQHDTLSVPRNCPGKRHGRVDCARRRLRLPDYDLARRVLRIEQSKGLKERIAYVSQAATATMSAYLVVRGPAADDHVFLYHHRPLSQGYCAERLQTYAARGGVQITPHQLRHTYATLLLNAGTPILTVQAILGHRHIDTTLGYARLYDGTVAADYYRAMAQVEAQMTLDYNSSTKTEVK